MPLVEPVRVVARRGSVRWDLGVFEDSACGCRLALQQAGKRFRFLPYPRVRHGIEDFAQQMHLFAEMEA